MHVQARKALRALKSLVKLQALVRGYLVRKQAATTLRRLQALMRLQARTASSRKSVEQVRILVLRDGLAQASFTFHKSPFFFVPVRRSGLLGARSR